MSNHPDRKALRNQGKDSMQDQLGEPMGLLQFLIKAWMIQKSPEISINGISNVLPITSMESVLPLVNLLPPKYS